MMQTSINETSVTVGVVSNSEIRGLYVSYFVFAPSAAGFVSYGGIASQPNVNGTVHQTIQMSLPSSNYNLFGLTGFSFVNTTRFNLEAGIDSRFILSTSGSSYNTTVSFIIVGNSPSSVCSGCR